MSDSEVIVAFLGDSITAAPDGYARLVADLWRAAHPRCRLRIVNAGRGGDRSVDLPPRLERDVLAHWPHIVTLSIGINDVWRGLDAPGQGLDVDLPLYQRSVENVVDTISATGMQVIVLTTSVIGELLDSEGNRRLQPYNAFLRAMATARGLIVADVYAAFREALSSPHPPALTTDGVHLTHRGNAVMAIPVLRALESALGMQHALRKEQSDS